MPPRVIESAMVFDREGRVIFWLGPNGCSEGAIADSQILWDRIWSDRDRIGGVAHTHPWEGPTTASTTDLTTWAAIEAGLGTRLYWPIVTLTHVEFFTYFDDAGGYGRVMEVDFRDTEHWHNIVKRLRLNSTGG
jgi:hypothetical protein